MFFRRAYSRPCMHDTYWPQVLDERADAPSLRPIRSRFGKANPRGNAFAALRRALDAPDPPTKAHPSAIEPLQALCAVSPAQLLARPALARLAATAVAHGQRVRRYSAIPAAVESQRFRRQL